MLMLNKLHFLIENNYNVLFRGKHGVGKTSIVKAAFDAHKLKWRYFSAATLDPWVDFVGVPKEKTVGKESYLELIRPKGLNEVEALFFDEFNRSHKKVRNAVMELMQFKSINGQPLPNLKFIWAAINPEDEEEEYQVEPIDPAQIDRFHAIIDIPYQCDAQYFADKYTEKVSNAAISWWNGLPHNQKKLVSPRRLDYALDFYLKDGDLRDVLPDSSNVSKLITTLKLGPIAAVIKQLFEAKDVAATQAFVTIENNFAAAIEIMASKTYRDFFVPLWPNEKIASFASINNKFLSYLTSNYKTYGSILHDICKANQNPALVKEILKKLPKLKANNGISVFSGTGTNPAKPYSAQFSGMAHQKIKDYINDMRNHKLSSHERRQAAQWVVRTQISNVPTLSETALLMEYLDTLAAYSHSKTLAGIPQFISAVNHLTKAMPNWTKHYKHLARKILTNQKLSGGLICPSQPEVKNPILPTPKKRGRPPKVKSTP